MKYTLILLLILVGCRSTPPAEKPVTGARPPIGLPPPEVSQDEPIPPPPAAPRVKKVAVILGPGGGKTFAHVGVLKALQQQRIPIEKVVGLEWGALMGGLFTLKGTTHDVEWKLYKMDLQKLLQPSGFFSRRGDENGLNVVDPFLNEMFGKEEIGKAKVPFACPSRSIWTGVVAWQSKGSFKEAMKRCLAFPPVFKAQGTFIAGASQASEAIEMLVKEGFNVIILVNVLGSAMPVPQDNLRDNLNYVILWQEVKRALGEASRLNIDTIQVDTSAVAVSQFGAKKDLVLLGEAAGQKAAAALISKYGF